MVKKALILLVFFTIGLPYVSAQTLADQARIDSIKEIIENISQRQDYRPAQSQQFVGASFINLSVAMSVSELFHVLTKGDVKYFEEFVKSMASEDQLIMLNVFHYSNLLSSQAIEAIVGNTEAFRALGPHMAMGLADVITNWFMAFYTHPAIQNYLNTFSETGIVYDPDNPGRKVISFADKREIRKRLKIRALKDVLVDISTDQMGRHIFFHGIQFVLVNLTFERFMVARETMFLSPQIPNQFKSVLFPVRVASRQGQPALEAVRLSKLFPASQIEALVTEASERVFLVKKIQWAKMTNWLRLAKNAGPARWLLGAGGPVSLAEFFLLDQIVTKVIKPQEFIETTISTRDVRNREEELDKSIDWYFKNAEKTLPPELQNKRDLEWFKLFNDLPKLKALLKKYDNRFAGYTYGDAFDFIFRLSLACFNDAQEQLKDTVKKCNSRSDCQEKLFSEEAEKFAKRLTEAQPVQFILNNSSKYSQAYSQFRASFLLNEVYTQSNMWKQKIDKMIRDHYVRQTFYIWISRGMSFQDPLFISNQDFWHYDKDTLAFEGQWADFVMEYDKNVLNMSNGPYQKNMAVCPGSQEVCTISNRPRAVAKHLENLKVALSKIHDGDLHNIVFQISKAQNNKVEDPLDSLTSSFFVPFYFNENDKALVELATKINELENQATDLNLKEEDGLRLYGGILSLKAQYRELMGTRAQEIISGAKIDGQVNSELRNGVAAIWLTQQVLARLKHNVFVAVKKENEKFQILMNNEVSGRSNSYMAKGLRKLAPKYYEKFVDSKKTGLFNQEGTVTRHLQLWKSLPAGLINSYNEEMLVHLKILNRLVLADNLKDKFLFTPKRFLKELSEKYSALELVAQKLVASGIPKGQIPLEIKASMKIFLISLDLLSKGSQSSFDSYTFTQTSEKLIKILSPVWPNLQAEIQLSDKKASIKAANQELKTLYDYLVQNLIGLEKNLDSRNQFATRATELEESVLAEGLENQRFAVPLYLVSGWIRGSRSEAQLINQMAAKVLSLQNQKLLKSRVGCFLRNDTNCN